MQVTILDPTDRVVCFATTESGSALRLLDDLHTEDVTTGEMTYEFTVAGAHPDAQHVKTENQVVFRDLDGVFQIMRIKSVATDHDEADSVTLTATCACAAEELSGVVQRPETWVGATAESMLTDVLAGTRWSAGIVDYVTMADFETGDYPGKFKTIQDIRELFGLWLGVRCTIDAGRITGRFIDLRIPRANATGKTFAYGKDIISLKVTEDSTDLCTAIVPLGASDASGAWVTIATVIADDKPEGQDWIGDEFARTAFGRLLADGTREHIMRSVNFADISDPTDLLAAARTALAKRVSATMTFELDPLMLDALGMSWEQVRVGDTVGIVDPRTGTSTTQPITAIKRSYVDRAKSGA